MLDDITITGIVASMSFVPVYKGHDQGRRGKTSHVCQKGRPSFLRSNLGFVEKTNSKKRFKQVLTEKKIVFMKC